MYIVNLTKKSNILAHTKNATFPPPYKTNKPKHIKNHPSINMHLRAIALAHYIFRKPNRAHAFTIESYAIAHPPPRKRPRRPKKKLPPTSSASLTATPSTNIYKLLFLRADVCFGLDAHQRSRPFEVARRVIYVLVRGAIKCATRFLMFFLSRCV